MKKNMCLERLYLDSNQLGQEGGLALAKVLVDNTWLLELHLSNNQLGDIGVQNFVSFPNTLTVLQLDGNEIGDQGMEDIAHGLVQSNVSLTALHLARNVIGDDGMSALNPALAENTTLRLLNVRERDGGKKEGTKMIR